MSKIENHSEIGLLIQTAGPHAVVETKEGQQLRCHIRRNAPTVVVGDQVTFIPSTTETSVITGHLPRKSLLSRPSHGGLKYMAANVDCIVLVMAPPPIFSEERIDRHLIAASALGIMPLILLNKSDLLSAKDQNTLERRLDVYRHLGYIACLSNTLATAGLATLTPHLQNKAAVLTGLSGVGKSSIIRTLTGNTAIRTDTVSVAQAGKHTTTVTCLYKALGGALIDSPGIREFALWKMPIATIIKAYPEFSAYLGKCRFRDCAHLSEPGCAVIEAANKGEINSDRLTRYQTITREIKQ